jgi:hypothetical protein
LALLCLNNPDWQIIVAALPEHDTINRESVNFASIKDMARPKKPIDPDMVEKLASHGCSAEQIGVIPRLRSPDH